jgi:type IV pilus assembly protein PilF
MARPQRKPAERSNDGSSRKVSHTSRGWRALSAHRSSILSLRLGWPLLSFISIGSVAFSCVHQGTGQAASAERRSESEYDVARDLFLSRRDVRGALAHAQKATELNEENAEAQHLVALVYLYFCAAGTADCRLREAERAARKALAVQNDFREAKNTLGVILIQEKRVDEAISVLRPLADDILYQTPWDAWGNLGLAYLEKGNANEAIEALRRSVAAEPRFCVGNYRLGLAYEKKGDLTAARDALTRAVETNRTECQSLQEAFEVRGRVLATLKDCGQARADWERCKQLSVDSEAGTRCVVHLKSTSC